jgi:hypothetical protein
MDVEERIKLFSLGDTVAFPPAKYSTDIIGAETYKVVGINDDIVIIENENGKREISPFALLTTAEHEQRLKQAQVDIRKQL